MLRSLRILAPTLAILALPVCGQAGALYLIAGTPANEVTPYFPTTLYTVDAGGTLRMVRAIFGPGVRLTDLRSDLHGTFYALGHVGEVWPENENGGRLSMVHEDNPAGVDVVIAPEAACCTTFMWGGIAGPKAPPGAIFGDTNNNGSNPEVSVVLADPRARPRIVLGNWGMYAEFQFEGETGGPLMPDSPGGGVDRGQTFIWASPRPDFGRLGPAPPDLRSGQRVDPLAATDRYLVIWPVPAGFAAGVTPDSVVSFPMDGVRAYTKRTRRWARYDLPAVVNLYSGNRVRVFGDWLVTIESGHAQPGQRPGAGWDELRHTNVHDETEYNFILLPFLDAYKGSFVKLYLPGKLYFLNLADGRRFTLDTGQMDSEVLAIQPDGAILYRVYDTIYSGRIEGTIIDSVTKVVRGADVPEVHWAFWSAAGGGVPSGVRRGATWH